MSFASVISRMVPPPQYMTLPSAGVDISDTSLKYIQFTPNLGHHHALTLTHWGEADIPSDTLTRGNVKNGQQLTEVLKEIKSKLSTPYVRVSLPEERAYLFETNVKKGSSFKEIRGLLEFRLEENVPLSPRDAFFDYHIIGDTPENKDIRVAVTAYSRETILGYHEAVRAAGLTALSFEVEAQAIARATLPKNDPHTHLIVDFGKTRTGVGIVYKGDLMYTSTIDIGGKELSVALRRQLGDLPESELTKIKNTKGLLQSTTDAAVYEALISTMSAIKDEISLRIQYWNNNNNGLPGAEVNSVIFCGGSANLKGLPGYFTETLGIPAKRAQVWLNAFDTDETIPPIDRRHSFGYATAIGLALTQHV